MTLQAITREAVEQALRQFDRQGREAMLEQYGGGPSTRWYIRHFGKYYDQKLVLRAAHEISGLGALPPGPGTFAAGQAKRFIERLGFEVVDPAEEDRT